MVAGRVVPRLVCVGLVLAVTACALDAQLPTEPVLPADPIFARMPREIRTGAADMVIERVDRNISREEVSHAVQALVQDAPICFPWPGLWLDASDRRSVYFARFDLMARDWGAEVAAESRRRMQEFVDLGFLAARDRPDLGPGAVEYSLTPTGAQFLHGSPYGGERPSFCGPAQRRVVEITSMQFGDFNCGSLHVGFTHVADDWPTWARSEAARARISATLPRPGVQATGSVSLSRQWFRRGALPPGTENGALHSICYDNTHQRVVGDDLELSPTTQTQASSH